MGAPAGVESVDELYHRCRDGDQTAFTEVYRRFGGALYGSALRMLGRPEDAEEAVQETFLKLHRHLPELPPAQLPSWLHRVLANDCLDRLRRKRRWQLQELRERPSSAGQPPPGIGLDIARAAAGLPFRARCVFLLHDVEGFRHREVADMLGITEGASKSQLFRARALMRKFIERAPRSPR